MSQNRPADKRQVEMFNLIEQELLKVDLEKYEISNFAQKTNGLVTICFTGPNKPIGELG